MLHLTLIITLFSIIYCDTREELLVKNPSLWPGHLEPFGSKQNTIEVDQISSWPDPATFFSKYVDGNKPVLFKGLAKLSPAYELFDDEYLKRFEGSDEHLIYAEPEKKENRSKQGFEMSFKEFIERYHSESLYMVNPLPQQLRKDVRMPPPLRCEETRQLLSSQVTWFSSGGTKSVLHNDDVDNINCLFRGTKELFFVEYAKNKKFVPIDQPQGGYSSLDVDRVDYTKYPLLRHVDQYIHASMEEGDCIFIPYHWFHQVNSKENKKGQNLAVNVWFSHVHEHQPKDCMDESKASLDLYSFLDDDTKMRQESDEEEGENKVPQSDGYLDRFEKYLYRIKKQTANFKIFLALIKKDRSLNPTNLKLEDNPEDFKLNVFEVFTTLDVTRDNRLTKEDFDELHNLDDEQIHKKIESLSKSTAVLEDYFEDLVEESYQEAARNKANIKTDTSTTDESRKTEL